MDTVGEGPYVNLNEKIDLSYGFSKEYPNGNNGNVQDLSNEDEIDESYKSIAQLTADDILGLEFSTESEAIDFYKKYAKFHGFVMRKDDVARDLMDWIIMRQLVCSRAGLRDKKYLTRVDRKKDLANHPDKVSCQVSGAFRL